MSPSRASASTPPEPSSVHAFTNRSYSPAESRASERREASDTSGIWKVEAESRQFPGFGPFIMAEILQSLLSSWRPLGCNCETSQAISRASDLMPVPWWSAGGSGLFVFPELCKGKASAVWLRGRMRRMRDKGEDLERLREALLAVVERSGRSIRDLEREIGVGHGTLGNMFLGRTELR